MAHQSVRTEVTKLPVDSAMQSLGIAWNHGRLVIASENLPETRDMPEASLTIIDDTNDQDLNRFTDTFFGAVAA
jgi:hypothetical protein